MKTPDPKWFDIENIHELDSPALLLYTERAKRNIQRMITRAGGTERLMPHVKTNKMPAVVRMMVEVGIIRFKCATIAEAEMVAQAGGNYVVIAHQLVPPKTRRLLALQQHYPDVFFASLLDNIHTARQHNDFFAEHDATSHIFLDVNNGMNRSGTPLNANTVELYKQIAALPNIRIHGIHAYDGHIRDEDFALRQNTVEAGFSDVEALCAEIARFIGTPPMVIAGGTPAFSVHALHAERYCSPGTCVRWDWGYEAILLEQEYEYAALVLARIVSKPAAGLITVDMGHKAVAAENPIDKRIRFLNLSPYELLSQSEEHSVIRLHDAAAWQSVQVGDALYGVPYHVCPTVNLYDEAYSIVGGKAVETLQVLGRKRRITV